MTPKEEPANQQQQQQQLIYYCYAATFVSNLQKSTHFSTFLFIATTKMHKPKKGKYVNNY